MTILLLFAIMFGAWTSESQAQVLPKEIDLRWVYLNDDIRWAAAPKRLAKQYSSLNSHIVVFYPTGQFASVGCTLYRDRKTKRITLSMGDDFSVSKGTWTLNSDGTITTEANVTHGMPRQGGYEVHRMRWVIRKKGVERIATVIELGRERYSSMSMIGNFDQLSGMIADDNL